MYCAVIESKLKEFLHKRINLEDLTQNNFFLLEEREEPLICGNPRELINPIKRYLANNSDESVSIREYFRESGRLWEFAQYGKHQVSKEIWREYNRGDFKELQVA